MLRKFKTIICLLSLAFYGCGVAAKSQQRPTEFGAWVTYWNNEKSMASINLIPRIFGEALFFYGHLNSKGQPVIARTITTPAKVVGESPENKMEVWLTFVNDVELSTGKFKLKDSNIIHKMLSDRELSEQHRTQIVNLAQSYGVSGVDIDYENLLVEDKVVFSNFVELLSQDLHRVGLKLSVTVQPKTKEKNSIGAGAMDWAQICTSADRIQIMLYNLHSGRSNPGPISTISWIKDIMQYAMSTCDKFHIIPVLKVVGRDWGVNGSRDIQYQEVQSLLSTHNIQPEREPKEEGATPFFKYFANDGLHSIFYEDAESLISKTHALHSLGFPHVVFWGLGNHDQALHNKLLELRNTQ